LPSKYGIDDIPLILTDRSFSTANQFKVVPYGDSMVTNGTLRAQFTVPAQVIRLRLLNAAIERSYNIGFSDGRKFYLIATDGGLVDKPVELTRFLLNAGERIEILVDCSGQSGKSFDLKAYNSTLNGFIPGGENFVNGPFGNALGKKDFNILHLNVGSSTASPITSIPKSLTTNVFPAQSSAKLTRLITLSDSSGVPGILGPNAFILGRKLFKLDYINHTVPLNNTEIWELKSTSVFAHPFHIHDVEFYILSRNGVAPKAEEQGWKDVVLVKSKETVRFIAKFDDYADEIHPFMYHCHISLHEDEGMMGQFVVKGTTANNDIKSAYSDFDIFPNPAENRIFIRSNDDNMKIYYVSILNASGKVVMMLPAPELERGIDISSLAKGLYIAQITDDLTKKVVVKKFIKE
jgi:bilirubin oxidase